MSFWENNKGTFKSAGVATVKAVGSGGKALGKAGYRTYKNSEAKRKGQSVESDETGSSLNAYVPPLDPHPDLKSFPAPPRRNTAGSASSVSAGPSSGQPAPAATTQLPPQPAQQGQNIQQPQQQQGYQQNPQLQPGQQPTQPQLQNYGQQYVQTPQAQPNVAQVSQPPQLPSRGPQMLPQQPQGSMDPANSGQSNVNAQSQESQQQGQFQIPPAITNSISLAVAGAVTQTISQSANQMVQDHRGQGQNGQAQTQGQNAPGSTQQPQGSGQSQIQSRFQNNLQSQFSNQLQNTFALKFPGQSGGSPNTTQQTTPQTAQIGQQVQNVVSPQPVAPAPTDPAVAASLPAATQQPVYYQAPGTINTATVDTPAPAVTPLTTSTGDQPVTSPQAESPKKWAQNTRAGHFEVDENGEEKYIPKPAPDASHFAPPPIHRARGSNTASPAPAGTSQTTSPAVSRQSTSNRPGPPPTLPSRNTTTAAATKSQDSVATKSQPSSDSSHADASAHTDHAPVKFVDIDINKFGPPPPRIFRGNEPAPNKSHQGPPTHKANSLASPPPPLPTRQSVQQSELPKKTPPPKPAKPVKPPKPQFNRTNTNSSIGASSDNGVPSAPPPYSEIGSEVVESSRSELEVANTNKIPTSSAVPNFAAQIAKLRSNNDATETLSTNDRASTEVNSEQPFKKAPPKPVRQPKPVVPSAKPEPSKPLKPAVAKKPETLAAQTPPIEKEDAPPPMPVRPPSQELTPPPMPARHSAQAVPPLKKPDSTIKKPDSPIRKGPPPKPAKLQSQGASSEKSVQSPPVDSTKLTIPQIVAPETVPKPTPPPSRSPAPLAPEAVSRPTPPPSRSSAPQPPPSRSPAPQGKDSTPPPPPPPRNYSRPAAEPPKVSSSPPALDLGLASGWFANTSGPLELPQSFSGLNYSSSYLYSTRSTPMGNLSDHTREMNVTLKDLSKVTYQISWKNNDAATATSQITKFVPSPIESKRLSKQELVGFSQQFGEHVAAWCLHREGEQVGSGECWDLAHDALLKGCGKHAFVSTYYHHGYPILELRGSAGGSQVVRGPEDEVRKGDILQFTSAKFENPATRSTQTAGDPNHTSVVIDKIGDRIMVAEQNVQGIRKVRKGEYVLHNIVGGSVVVYRPVSAQWAE